MYINKVVYFAFREIETTGHLFASCIKTRLIWECIFKWMDWNVAGWEDELIDTFFAL
ncbi:hypothetical protein MtrunA17_Chr1g0152941 [Medicago truncatula]|uniref:Uncharacterized protein n=1 Tax=Medicago truncatula TaxID=3880 RepID=G7I2A9_MEDTR|nr:hypothetical protein MTR_1g018770 [Medicago truncatula]RHN77267.1 hypothetical protein MtrunA17_Chr1g0152941 [Medicago truncatula]